MLFSFTQYECKTRYCAADAVECAGTDETRDCATPAPQPATLTGIKIDGRVQALQREGTLTDAGLVLCLRSGLNETDGHCRTMGGVQRTLPFFTYFLGKGCAQRVAHSWWRTDRRSGRHKMCVTWWAVSLHRADLWRMACPADT